VFVHGSAIHDEAMALIAAGVNDCEIARRLGIPRTTIRDWRRHPRAVESCPRCWRATRRVRFTPADYAELLGLYLGDGHISVLARTERLRIFLDRRHSTIVDDAEALLRRAFPENRVGRVHPARMQMEVVYVYHGHLSCLFPQHGPGKKHHRRIELESWQRAHVHTAPWAFIRGCIRSDGCVFMNRTGKYEYRSYCFDNRSADVRELFIDACGLVGVEVRPSRTSVRIYRRPSVALMLEHVGVKN
jgi:hypothetical protein